MDVIITKNDVDYGKSFVKLPSLKLLLEKGSAYGRINCLVYNNSTDKPTDVFRYCDKLSSKVTNFIYIHNGKPNLKIKMGIQGIGGSDYSAEYALKSEEALKQFLNNRNKLNSLVSLGGVDVLNNFLESQLSNTSEGKIAKGYLMVVKNAVNTLVDQYNEKSELQVQMSEQAVEMFSDVRSTLDKMSLEVDNLQNQLLALEKESKNKFTAPIIEKPVPTFKSGSGIVSFFPVVDLMKDLEIFRLKEIGSGMYFSNFIGGMQNHFNNVLHLRTKLIIIFPVGAFYEKQFSNYPWVTTKNYTNRENFFNPIVCTNHPSRDVINKLVEDLSYDTFIIADRTKSSEKCIVNAKCKTVFVSSSETLNKQLNLNNNQTIYINKDVDGMLGKIPKIQGYSTFDKEEQLRAYINVCNEIYRKIYNTMGKKR